MTAWLRSSAGNDVPAASGWSSYIVRPARSVDAMTLLSTPTPHRLASQPSIRDRAEGSADGTCSPASRSRSAHRSACRSSVSASRT